MTTPEPPNPPQKARKRSAGLTSLTGDREFRQVRGKGKAVRTRLFTLRAAAYRPKRGEAWRPMTVVGLVVSKKTLKRAVDRNRARRRVREALRAQPLPPCRAILVLNEEVLRADFEELRAALRDAFDRASP